MGMMNKPEAFVRLSGRGNCFPQKEEEMSKKKSLNEVVVAENDVISSIREAVTELDQEEQERQKTLFKSRIKELRKIRELLEKSTASLVSEMEEKGLCQSDIRTAMKLLG